MKKILAILLFSIITFGVSAESLWCNGYEISMKYKNSGWTEWKSCTVPIEIKTDEDIIVIYSNETQIYRIYDDGGQTTDNGGWYTTKVLCNRSEQR